MFLNGHAFILNSLAMGDVICTAPVIKHMVENFYTKPESYLVVAKRVFRPFFPFVPDANFRNLEEKDNSWGIPAGFAMSTLNLKNNAFTRNTPKHMHLCQFAAIKLTDRLLGPHAFQYVPLEEVDVSHFGIDFKKSVILVTSFRDITRAWHAEYILETAAYIKSKGFLPIFIGKTEDIDPNLVTKTSLPPDVSEFGVDLRDKTSIPELASIFRQAKAVCGIDSGPIHLAGTTRIPIICGYTSISPEYRIPFRPKGKTYAVTPPVACIGCESKWESHYWNFEQCYLKHVDCCNKMTAKLFIKPLSGVLY